MAKTRQRAREERERLAALASAERERAAAKDAARRSRRARWSLASRRGGRPGGVLAARRATYVRMTVAILAVFNLFVFLVTRDWTVVLTLVVSVLVAPVVFTLISRKR